LVGENGAGKSTLMKVLTGAITQDPVAMGYLCVEAAVKLMNGEDLGTTFIDAGFAWYNADNMDDPDIAPCLYD